MKFAVVVFPGSNCDHDAHYAAAHVLGQQAELIWHKDASLKGADVVILPGGFAHGDYLRTGAIARFSPIMQEVKRFADAGGPVLGICNGFQVLLEAGMLPGAMLRNVNLHFHCEHVYVKVEQADTPFTLACSPIRPLKIPVAHGEGNYIATPETIKRLEDQGRIVFRYAEDSNPNGALNDIAGIVNEAGNVIGMMPHPENMVEPLHGATDCRPLFESLKEAA